MKGAKESRKVKKQATRETQLTQMPKKTTAIQVMKKK